MIQLEIIKSPDANIFGTFKFYLNEIHLGRTIGNLVIQDKELSDSHLMIEVVGQDLIVHPQKNVSHYLLNGKRTTVVRKIKAQDVITIGDTVIKLAAFEETTEKSKKNILDDKLAQLIEENSTKLTVIEKLSKMMK